MHTSPLRYCLTLLFASGGCLLGSAASPTALCAQTLPPQGVPNVSGSGTPDGPVTASGTNSPTLGTSGQPLTSSGSNPASPSSAGGGTSTNSVAATPAQVQSSSSPSPSPSGGPSGSAGSQPPQTGSAAAPSTSTSTSAAASPQAKPAVGAAAQAAEENDDTVYLENADLLRLTSDNSAELTGHVEVRYRDYTLFADHAVVNQNTGRVVFDGNVRVFSSATKTAITATNAATELELNSRDNTYSVVGAQHAVIDPQLLQGSELLLPLRVDSKDAYSVNNILDVRQGGFTTCDFLHPHYYIGTRSMTVIPGRRLVARHAVLYRRGRRLFEIPYLIVPLNDRYTNADYLPLVGEDSEEGYYAKFAIPYALAGAALGVLRIDTMSKIGVGTGFDQSYQSHGSDAGGTLSLYHLDDHQSDTQEFTGSLVHQQSIGNFQIGINSQYESNSYYSSSSNSENLTGTLNVSGSEGRNTTLFTSNLTQSNYGEGLASNLTASLNQLERIGGLNTFGVKLNYTNTDASITEPGLTTTDSSGNTTTTPSVTTTTIRSTLASNLDLHLQPNGLMVDLQTDLFSTLTNSTNESLSSFAGLQRRPEIMLTTTGTGSDPLDEIAHLVRGSQLQLGLGQYVETHLVLASDGTDQELPFDDNRLYFSYDGGAQTRRTGDFTLTSDSSFQQAFYSDGGAQYLLNGRYGSAYTRGPLSLSANYTTLREYGYTPFLFDRPGQFNNANFTFGYTPVRSVTLSAATAYNFLQDRGIYAKENGVNTLLEPAAPWQNLIGILTIHPNPLFNEQLQATYDPNKQRLFDVTNNFYAANSHGFGFRTAADYLPERNQFGLINGALDLPIILDQREQAGYKIQALAGYDGLTSKFTYQGIALTRSWHDFEITATYQNNPYSFGTESNTFSFTFHLKALPGYQPFGVGASGQQLAGGIGQVY